LGRNDGGYIDRVSPDTGQTVQSKSNYQESFAGRAALAAAPVDHLKITASLLYQDVYNHDRNQYWSTLSSLSDANFKQGSRVILDPNDPTQIYINTFGGGVWHGPATGAANPPEADLTPVPIAHSAQ